ncbi:MAG: hypothetical protein MZV65_16360 [Chromatiales bacterium]|nr:hypothetical protein [Chromatiales bacterium]
MSDKRSMEALSSILKHMDLMSRRDAFAQHVDDIPSSLTVSGIPVPKILKSMTNTLCSMKRLPPWRWDAARSVRNRVGIRAACRANSRNPAPAPSLPEDAWNLLLARVLGDRKRSETDIDVLTDRVLNAYLEEVKATAPHSHYREWVRAWLKAYFSGDAADEPLDQSERCQQFELLELLGNPRRNSGKAISVLRAPKPRR